jgi:hypothetical protein
MFVNVIGKYVQGRTLSYPLFRYQSCPTCRTNHSNLRIAYCVDYDLDGVVCGHLSNLWWFHPQPPYGILIFYICCLVTEVYSALLCNKLVEGIVV